MSDLNHQNLYRYRGNIQNEAVFLSTGFIYVPAFDELNDPYDGLLNISITNLEDVRERTLRSLAEKYPTESPSEIESRCAEVMTGLTPEQYKKEITVIAETTFRRQFKVLSFSSDPINELMWAHYAAQHKGICLQFNPDSNTLIKKRRRVIYDKQPFKFAYPSKDDGSMTQALLTKSQSWAYEQESRVFVLHNESQVQKLESNALIGIIFGLLTPKATKDQIRRWVEEGPFSPRYYIIKKKLDTYTLEIEEEFDAEG
jgi:hypothetical protein